MSTTFEVYPGRIPIPSIRDLLTSANGELANRLASLNVAAQLHIEMRESDGDELIPCDLDSPMVWNSDESYAWFVIPGVLGGTDAYYHNVDDVTREVWSEYLQMDRFSALRDAVSTCLEVGHYWVFRRSAGQPGIINLSYGLLAGCLAQLTDGIIFSDDSAWAWNLLPMRGDEFLTRYLVPGGTRDSSAEEWTMRCLSRIPDELSG